MKHEWSEAVFGFGIGIPLVAIAWIYPFRTELLTPRLRASIEAHAYRWWPVAVLLAFIYVVGPDIYRRATAPISPPPIVQGFTQQQVDEKIADALKTEKAKTPPATIIHDPPTQEQIDKAAKPLVDEAVRKRDEAEQALRAERAKPSSTARVAELEARVRELEAQPPLAGAPLGPATTMSMISQLGVEGPGMGVRGPSPAKFHWAIVFTAPQQDERIRPFLTSLLATAGMDVLPLRPADHSVNLDAPEFPEPGNAGITLHGENVLNARLLEVLRPCLIVRATAKTVDRLEWYRSSLKEQDRIIVWIEIGNGEPWTRERRCWM